MVGGWRCQQPESEPPQPSSSSSCSSSSSSSATCRPRGPPPPPPHPAVGIREQTATLPCPPWRRLRGEAPGDLRAKPWTQLEGDAGERGGHSGLSFQQPLPTTRQATATAAATTGRQGAGRGRGGGGGGGPTGRASGAPVPFFAPGLEPFSVPPAREDSRLPDASRLLLLWCCWTVLFPSRSDWRPAILSRLIGMVLPSHHQAYCCRKPGRLLLLRRKASPKIRLERRVRRREKEDSPPEATGTGPRHGFGRLAGPPVEAYSVHRFHWAFSTAASRSSSSHVMFV
ncbi:trithorax group protein osa-like [Crotalus tigris]|uniref:trithorax group protein osa-like n=1 Tax=Crotalus tigris TaxID=88082 RepID=UPI00192F299E|nr:trithorax group protein osa-like [Crotalus tigris]